MKILKIIFISVFVLVLIVIAAALIFIKTFDVNRYKPQIIEQASRALNRPVNFQKAELGVSWTRGLSFKVFDLAIAEDPLFRKGAFLAVKNISLGVDVPVLLFQKKVFLPNIFIDSPEITIIRQKDGGWNVASLISPGAKEKKGAVSGRAPAQAPGPLAMPAIFISSLKLENGTANYIDKSFEPPVTLEISLLNVSVSNISLSKPFSFVIEGAVLGDKRNIRIEGKARIDLKTNEITFSELKGTTDFSEFLLAKIPISFPMTKGAVLPERAKGKAGVDVSEALVGPRGLMALAAGVRWENGALQFKEIASAVKDIQMNGKATLSKFALDKVSASVGGGVIRLSGIVSDYLGKQDFNADINFKDLKIQELLNQDKAPVKVQGAASGQLKLKGQGFTPDALNSSLSGEGNISVTEVKLKGINVLRAVLDKISVIPGLSEKVQANLPDRYKQKLTQEDTSLRDMELPVTIKNGRLLIKDTTISADEFTFKGQTEAGFNGAFSLEGSFLIPQELSAAMVAGVPQLQYLLDENKEMFIPLKVSGKAGQMNFNVDAATMSQKILMNQAKTQLIRVINKALGSADQNGAQAGGENSAAPGDLIGGLLGTTLKK